MSDGLAESVKQVIEERIKNPLWGFIILAWGWFNWPNLAMLFMSDAPVKFRIDYILSQDLFYLHYIVAPLFAGCLLAVVSPYAQLLLSQAHKWADDRYRRNVIKIKEKNLEDAISLSTLKVKADRAEEFAKAKSDADIQVEVERGKREQLKTEELEAIKKAHLDELENLRTSVSIQKEEVDSALKQKVKIQDLIVDSLLLLEKFFKVSDSSSIQSLKEEVEKLYSTREIQMSTLRNVLDGKRELKTEQAMTFLEHLKEKGREDKLKKQADSSFENE